MSEWSKDAALKAVEGKTSVGSNPTSLALGDGTHHAPPDRRMGFCLGNGAKRSKVLRVPSADVPFKLLKGATNMGEELYVPRAVAKLVQRIQDGTQRTPEVQKVGDRRYRVTVTNDRVHCTVDYKFTGNRWDWANSKLTVDGKPHKIMPSPEAFFRLFHDPDSDGLKRIDVSEIAELEPIPADSPYASNYAAIAESVTKRIQNVDSSASAAILMDRNQPVLEFRLARGLVRWTLHTEGPKLLLFVFDGFDVRDQAGKTVEEVFAFLAEQHGVPVPPAATQQEFSHSSSSTPSISNAVRVRRQTVIRT